MRVNIKEFLYKYRSAEYRYGIFIPEDIYIQCSQIELNSLLKGSELSYIDLPDNVFDIIEANKKEQEDKDNIDNIISAHRIGGMGLEKEGNIEDAIKEYIVNNG